jgi:hypothetical protein
MENMMPPPPNKKRKGSKCRSRGMSMKEDEEKLELPFYGLIRKMLFAFGDIERKPI